MTVDITVNGTNQIYQVMGIIHRLLALQIGTDGIRDEVHSVGRQKYHILETTVRDREMGRIRFRITTHIDYERYANGHLALTAIPEWYKPDPVLQEQLGLLIEENRATTEVELRTSIGELGPTDPLKLLTPTGQIISLRQGSTPLDFACFIHGNIGLRASGALVNGKEIPLTEPFKREHYGSTVKIITDPPGAPSALRLRAVRTSRARQVLRHALRERSLGQTIDDGRTNLNQAFGIFALTANQVQSATITKGLERTMRAKPFHLTVERRPPGVHSAFAHLCHAIGMGEIDPGEFVRQFVEEMSETANERRASRTKKGRRNPFFVLRGTLRDGKRLGEILMELERLGLHPTDTRTRGNRITVKLENEGIVQRWQLNNLSPLFLNDVSVRSTPLPRQT